MKGYANSIAEIVLYIIKLLCYMKIRTINYRRPLHEKFQYIMYNILLNLCNEDDAR